MWLPAEAFYVRRIVLDVGAPAEPQVELALEAAAPFALEQLYHGFVGAPPGAGALLFATHRRLFAGQDWAEAVAVLPAFLPLVLNPPTAARLRFWRHDLDLTVAGWDGSGPLPAVVLSRRAAPGGEAECRVTLLDEAAGRLALANLATEEYTGPAEIRNLRQRAGWEFVLKGAGATPDLRTRCEGPALETADVRDPMVLQTRRQRQRRNRLLWRGFALGAAGMAMAALLELALSGGGKLFARQQATLEARAVAVAKIEAAQALGARVEELAQRRFRPFEMLAVLNEARPASVQFVRSVNQGHHTLVIEAQARDAVSVGAYEGALRGIAVLESVEIRDVRLREGLVTFQLTVVFKPAAFGREGGRP